MHTSIQHYTLQKSGCFPPPLSLSHLPYHQLFLVSPSKSGELSCIKHFSCSVVFGHLLTFYGTLGNQFLVIFGKGIEEEIFKSYTKLWKKNRDFFPEL